jgi:hypothetical protein
VIKGEPLSAFIPRLAELSAAIDENRRAQRVIPTLILIYTTIDALSALETGRASRSTFVAWVDEFIVSQRASTWTAWDLYAARCSILHTLTSESALTESRHARQMLYSWGTADEAELRRAASVLPVDTEVLHIDDLIDRFNSAVSRMIDLFEGTGDRAARVREGASKWYVTIPSTRPA